MPVCPHIAGGANEEHITYLGLEGQYLLRENQYQENEEKIET